MLTVADNPRGVRYIRDVPTRTGYAPVAIGDPADIPCLMAEHKPHLELPGTYGIELMQEVHRIADVPVTFLSEYGQDDTVAQALDIGAADHVVKPFSPTELAAPTQATLRMRTAPERVEPSEPYELGDLNIDFVHRRVTVLSRDVQLTATEYDLLVKLAVNAGGVIRHEELLQRV